MKRIEISIDSLDGLAGVSRAILESLEGRSVVLLRGDMGAGKTTLVRSLASCLGSEDNVTSPTFALVNEYVDGRGGSFFHFDMYRVESLDEAIDMGFSEYLDSGCLCFIEWSERVEALLPDREDVMIVSITAPSASERLFSIE